MAHVQVCTIGYGGKRPCDFFNELASLDYDIVVDVREDPFHAYLSCYTKQHLEKELKDSYIWIRELGKTVSFSPSYAC